MGNINGRRGLVRMRHYYRLREAAFFFEANMAKSVFLLVATLMVQLTGGKDLYWVHNTNWDVPSNWALGRVPCGGDNVMVSEASLFFLREQ